MKYLDGVKKSDIIFNLYAECFNEKAVINKDKRNIDFSKLLKKLKSENRINSGEVYILESALMVFFDSLLKYIDSEPRIKVVIE